MDGTSSADKSGGASTAATTPGGDPPTTSTTTAGFRRDSEADVVFYAEEPKAGKGNYHPLAL